jgi:hypothetical protein
MPPHPLLRAALALLGTAALAAPPAPPAPHLLPPALSTSTRCSACTAVASALHARLAAEAPRNGLDWRGRVGPNGERRGVRLAYEVSEARLDALLDGLCSADGLRGAAWWSRDGDAAGRGGGDDDREGVWVTSGGAPPPGWTAPASRAEREARDKALENACGQLVSDAEEGLGAALLTGGGGAGVEDVGVLLCETLAKVCGPGEGAVVRAGGEGGGEEAKDEL